MTDPHDLENGGHEPVDVDPYIPTGICAACEAANTEQGNLPQIVAF